MRTSTFTTRRLLRTGRESGSSNMCVHLKHCTRSHAGITPSRRTAPAIRDQRPTSERVPWDWRILLNGKADELLYEHRALVTGGLPFAELKQRSLIDAR